VEDLVFNRISPTVNKELSVIFCAFSCASIQDWVRPPYPVLWLDEDSRNLAPVHDLLD
jgi:hypothetical protein